MCAGCALGVRRVRIDRALAVCRPCAGHVLTMCWPRLLRAPKAYDDGFTLSLIWKLLSDAMGKHNAVPQPGSANGTRPLVDAAHYGVPRGGQGRDRTWATIREDKAAYEAAHAVAAAKASGAGAAGRSASAASILGLGGSCLCQCPPDQGFGKCWNVPKADVPKAPADGKCPPHIQARQPQTSLPPLSN